jgi:hypothetical protein
MERFKRWFVTVAAATVLGAGLAVVANGQTSSPSGEPGSTTNQDVPVNPADLPPVSHGPESIHVPDQAATQQLVPLCQETLKDNPDDKICLVVMRAAEGKVNPGDYPESELDDLAGVNGN